MNIKPKTLRNCLSCNKIFQAYPYLLKKGFGKFCSVKCSSVLNTTKIKKGQRLSPQTEFKKGDVPWNWKGDAVGYKCLHDWVRKRLGKPRKCEFCKTTTAKRFEWANKSQQYKRDLTDWLRLCTSCHRNYDYGFRRQYV